MLAECLRSLGLILTRVGRHDEAVAVMGRSRALFRALAEADPAGRRLRVEWARSEVLFGKAVHWRDRHLRSNQGDDEALESLERARALLEAPAGASPAEDVLAGMADANGTMAMILETAGRRDEALAAYTRACDLGEVLFRADPENPTTSHELNRTLGELGAMLRSSGRPAEAVAAYERARAVIRAARAAHPTLWLFLNDSAEIDTGDAIALVALGRDAEALQAFERAGRSWRP